MAEPAGLPPEPTERHLTPAPEDYAARSRPPALLWAVGWIALGVVLYLLVRAVG